MKKILITGGSGFIGKHLQRVLAASDYEIIAPSSSELDVLCESDWKKYNDGFDLSHLIHLAGKIFVPDSWETPRKFFDVNTGGTLHALEFCRTHGIGMTYVSAYIYGTPAHLPVEETALPKPTNPYACAKFLGERLCVYYNELFGVNVTILRPFNIYGPAQSERMLIPTIISQIVGGKEEVVVNDISPKRDYIYIDDVCSAISLAIERTQGIHIFNIGYGVSYSVKDVINRLQRICKTSKKIVSRNCKRKNELNDVVADIKSIEKAWGWKPSVTLEAGLRKSVEWYYENNNTN